MPIQLPPDAVLNVRSFVSPPHLIKLPNDKICMEHVMQAKFKFIEELTRLSDIVDGHREIDNEIDVFGVPILGDSRYIEQWYEPHIANQKFRDLLQIEWNDRNARVMRYRKSPFPRSKAFFIKSWKRIPIYNYPGFQYQAVLTYKRIKGSAVEDLRDDIEALSGFPTNHIICTLYKNGFDYINYHDDKTETIDPNVPIFILSFGAERALSFKHNTTGKVIHFTLKSGSLFILGHDTNRNYQHAILPTGEACGPRVSVIIRNIDEELTPDEMAGRIARSITDTNRRDRKNGKKTAPISVTAALDKLRVLTSAPIDSDDEDEHKAN